MAQESISTGPCRPSAHAPQACAKATTTAAANPTPWLFQSESVLECAVPKCTVTLLLLPNAGASEHRTVQPSRLIAHQHTPHKQNTGSAHVLQEHQMQHSRLTYVLLQCTYSPGVRPTKGSNIHTYQQYMCTTERCINSSDVLTR